MSIGVVITKGKRGGFEVTDAIGRVHFAPDSAALGGLLAELVDDPAIPQPQYQQAESPAVEVVAGAVRRFLPQPFSELFDAARPVVSGAPPMMRALKQVLQSSNPPPRKRRSKARVRSVREDT